jgi:hypothetical protein
MTTYLSDKENSWLAASIADLVEQARLYRSCLTCEHFEEATEVCRLAQVRPPARVIALGCPKYFEVPPF